SGILLDGKFTRDESLQIETKQGTATIDIKVGDTAADLVKKINDATEKKTIDGKENDVSLGLRAAYDSKLGKLMITTKESGVEQKIHISGSSIFADIEAKGSNAK
ncbi:flagellin hook IN motif-containing protein, partial [Stenotrophomonas maltophilia group sp. RNC7]|uniref:flagellin hook IN motif-containing protein n=1 Tax=Stenotrophomonas maltophilia group sp. RNC7 TaxID=3071467 RepID=UPI0027E16532